MQNEHDKSMTDEPTNEILELASAVCNEQITDDQSQRLREILDRNPADKHGSHLYRFADTGMEEKPLRERFQDYQRYFDIPSEAV